MRIEADNISCRRSGRLVFEGISFTLADGEALVVTGRNGAGKSSLLALLAGTLAPAAGAIRVAGLADRPLAEGAHLVGHRDALKLTLTAAENLAFARSLLGHALLPPQEALAALGLAHAGGLPTGYLSAGQRRRVALARLLVAHRPVWLLDEPMAALDAASQAILLDLIGAHLAQGGLVVATTHAPLPIEGAQELRLAEAIPSPLAGDGQLANGREGEAARGVELSPLMLGCEPIGSGLRPARRQAPASLEAGTAARPESSAASFEARSLRSLAPQDEVEVLRPFAIPLAAEGRESGAAAPLRALLMRDLRLAARIGGSGGLGLVFFLMIVTLVPFALGPDLNLLARIGPAILWLAAVLATLIGLDRLFQADDEDGSLDLLRSAPAPLELIVLAKVAAHWLTTGLPLALAAPLFGLLVALGPDAMLASAATLLVGTPALTFVGAIGAALTSSIRRGGLILAVLIAPLMIPTLIFGVSAANAAPGGAVPFRAPFLILLALTLVAGVVGTWAAAAALRQSE